MKRTGLVSRMDITERAPRTLRQLIILLVAFRRIVRAYLFILEDEVAKKDKHRYFLRHNQVDQNVVVHDIQIQSLHKGNGVYRVRKEIRKTKVLLVITFTIPKYPATTRGRYQETRQMPSCGQTNPRQGAHNATGKLSLAASCLLQRLSQMPIKVRQQPIKGSSSSNSTLISDLQFTLTKLQG